MSDDEVDTGGSGASLKTPIRGGEVKKGMCVFLKGKPCKAGDISISKTGKHGHAKARIEGKDIFTGKKYIDISPTSHTMYAPVVETETWMVLDINDGFFSLMNEETSETNDDLPLPPAESEDPELASKIESTWEECSESGRDMYVIVTTAPTSDTAKEAHSQVTGFKTGTE